jgi:ribosomal protein S18 acetylase RimI-like enzyme
MGFHAMQFNFVLASNTRAIAAWERYGFDTIRRIPEAYSHPQDGYVDALIIYQKL